MSWQSMKTAPRDGREIMVRRHNDVAYEHYVVWWADYGDGFPWRCGYDNAYPTDRLDDWHEIPK